MCGPLPMEWYAVLPDPSPPCGATPGPGGVSAIAQDLVPSLTAAERFFGGLFFESLSRREVSRDDGSGRALPGGGAGCPRTRGHINMGHRPVVPGPATTCQPAASW